MEQLQSVLPVVIQTLWAVLLLIFVLIAWQLFRVLRDLAILIRRVEMLTDIGGWIGLWKKFKKIK